jgi:hypothetical protein
MKTGVGWVDFSSEHRERVRSVMDLVTAPGVVDELGIGIIRDAFSDALFPGVSTIQTRPKYFVVVPRILRDYAGLDNKVRKRKPLQDYLAEQEMNCRVKLVSKHGRDEASGIIGVTFGERTDRDVQRRASSVYWNGLRTFRILKTNQSLSEYCREHSGYQPSVRTLLAATKKEMGDDVDADDVVTSPVREPPRQENWLENLSISLTQEEAEFLKNQVCSSKPESLLGTILLSRELTEEFVELDQGADFADLLELPRLRSCISPSLLEILRAARDFWRLLSGAHIRYNLLLQKRFGTQSELQDRQSDWDDWRSEIGRFDWNTWDTERLWHLVAQNHRQPRAWTQRFINRWIDDCRSGTIDASCDTLVENQELQNKRSRARLRAGNTDEAVNGWIGISGLSYRLPQAWRFITDIQRAEAGLEGTDA